MTLRKIKDLDGWPEVQRPCTHPEHRPPTMIVLTDGVWEYTCPGCGHVTTFTVANPRYAV